VNAVMSLHNFVESCHVFRISEFLETTYSDLVHVCTYGERKHNYGQ
jgi:hypothetical protein